MPPAGKRPAIAGIEELAPTKSIWLRDPEANSISIA